MHITYPRLKAQATGLRARMDAVEALREDHVLAVMNDGQIVYNDRVGRAIEIMSGDIEVLTEEFFGQIDHYSASMTPAGLLGELLHELLPQFAERHRQQAAADAERRAAKRAGLQTP